MQLNISTDYALRSLVYLATCGRQASSSEISEGMRIPDNYIYAVMGKLREAGLTRATRGVNGGWSLTKPAEEITLLEIFEAMEGSMKMNRCLIDPELCNRKAAGDCQMHDLYAEIQTQIESGLKSITLAQIRDRNWQPISEIFSQAV